MDNRVNKQLAFSLEIDKTKNVFRQTRLFDNCRNENDAEHSWHMAIMAYLFKEYANQKVDISKVMLMCLIHDIVEIDAGDTYAYDSLGLQSQKARENAAKQRIFSILPNDQAEEFIALFDEFEAYETPEAKFAHAIDNFQPLIINGENNEKDWRKHGVTKAQIYERHGKTRFGSKILYELTDHIIQETLANANFKD